MFFSDLHQSLCNCSLVFWEVGVSELLGGKLGALGQPAPDFTYGLRVGVQNVPEILKHFHMLCCWITSPRDELQPPGKPEPKRVNVCSRGCGNKMACRMSA